MRLAEQPVLQFKLGAEAVLMEARFPMAGDFMELQFHGAKLVVSSPALKSTPCSLLGTSTKNGVTYQFAEGVQDWQRSAFFLQTVSVSNELLVQTPWESLGWLRSLSGMLCLNQNLSRNLVALDNTLTLYH